MKPLSNRLVRALRALNDARSIPALLGAGKEYGVHMHTLEALHRRGLVAATRAPGAPYAIYEVTPEGAAYLASVDAVEAPPSARDDDAAAVKLRHGIVHGLMTGGATTIDTVRVAGADPTGETFRVEVGRRHFLVTLSEINGS